jgi:hypothetical protein
MLIFCCNLMVNAQKADIVLTEANKHGDCVSSGIYTSKNKFYFAKYFSIVEWCADGKMYIGINGITQQLKRIGKRPSEYPYLIGVYKSKNFIVSIHKTKLIEKLFFDKNSKNEANEMTYKYEVLITIKSSNKTKKIKGYAYEGI